jgi:hypothetical protein
MPLALTSRTKRGASIPSLGDSQSRGLERRCRSQVRAIPKVIPQALALLAFAVSLLLSALCFAQ